MPGMERGLSSQAGIKWQTPPACLQRRAVLWAVKWRGPWFLGQMERKGKQPEKKYNSSQAICPVTQFAPLFSFSIKVITVHYVELRNPSQDWAFIMCRLKGDWETKEHRGVFGSQWQTVESHPCIPALQGKLKGEEKQPVSLYLFLFLF